MNLYIYIYYLDVYVLHPVHYLILAEFSNCHSPSATLPNVVSSFSRRRIFLLKKREEITLFQG